MATRIIALWYALVTPMELFAVHVKFNNLIVGSIAWSNYLQTSTGRKFIKGTC